MTYVAATGEYGLIVRKEALLEKNIETSRLLRIMADIDVLGQDEGIISFGPIFGEESLDTISERLKGCGLDYVDDFVTLNFMMPEWVRIGVSLAES